MQYKRYYPAFYDMTGEESELIAFNSLDELIPQIYIPESSKNKPYSLKCVRTSETQITVSLIESAVDIWVRGFIYGEKAELDSIATKYSTRLILPLVNTDSTTVKSAPMPDTDSQK